MKRISISRILLATLFTVLPSATMLAFLIWSTQPQELDPVTLELHQEWKTQVDMSYGQHIRPEYMVENVLVTIFWFPTLEALQAAVGDDQTLGESRCETYIKKNLAHCDLLLVLPRYVDDEWINTMGHELAHGVFGDYH